MASLLTPSPGAKGELSVFFVCFLESSALKNTYTASQPRYNDSFIFIMP